MESIYPYSSFELELFDIGAFLQYTAYSIILHFRDIYFNADRARDDSESKQT